jgi:3-oxoacyl-[acyl-carrier-protein] synthase-1
MGAVRKTFGTDIPAISSTKSLSGHSLGAAGVQEAIYSLLMLEHGFIAGTKNLATPDEKIGDLPIVGPESKEATLNTVMSNSFGFGGTNASLVFERLQD